MSSCWRRRACAAIASARNGIGLVTGDEVESCEQASFRSLGRTKLMQLTKRKAPELTGKIAQL
jgi:hypothetical protein